MLPAMIGERPPAGYNRGGITAIRPLSALFCLAAGLGGAAAPYNTAFFHFYVNPRWFDALTAEQRGAIDAAAKRAEPAAIGITEDTARAALSQLRERGMLIHLQTPEESKAWAAAMQPPAVEAFLKAAAEDGPKLLEMFGKSN
jgi:TRAP-type C4-dicarboxylate transport system substrate-binding protein